MTITSTSSVLQQGLAGMQKSSREINKAADTIANANITVADTDNKQGLNIQEELTEPLINMKLESLIFEASAKVVKTADKAIGAILDIKA